MRPVVEVVRRRVPRLPAPPSAPLPEPVLNALTAVAGDLRHLPRDCIGDAAELLHWLRRMANRVEGVKRMRVPGAAPRSPQRPAGQPQPRPATPRDLAEAVFGKALTGTGAPEPRTIVSRCGRRVRVEVRRARAAGQMELGL